MTRVRLSVDIDSELRRRVKMVAAAREQSVKEWVEGAMREALIREAQQAKLYTPDESDNGEDRTWLDNDLSRLGEFEPYEWEEGELEEGEPVSYAPGVGVFVEGGKRRDRR